MWVVRSLSGSWGEGERAGSDRVGFEGCACTMSIHNSLGVGGTEGGGGGRQGEYQGASGGAGEGTFTISSPNIAVFLVFLE